MPAAGTPARLPGVIAVGPLLTVDVSRTGVVAPSVMFVKRPDEPLVVAKKLKVYSCVPGPRA